MRYLGVDHGQKRTGLAISDASETLVTPHLVIETSSQTELLRRILTICETEKVDAIVVGLPLNMDGSEGPRAQSVKQFAAALREKIDHPIFLHDERLSSFQADCLAQALELTRKKKKKRLDAIAAADILKSFFEQKNTSENTLGETL